MPPRAQRPQSTVRKKVKAKTGCIPFRQGANLSSRYTCFCLFLLCAFSAVSARSAVNYPGWLTRRQKSTGLHGGVANALTGSNAAEQILIKPQVLIDAAAQAEYLVRLPPGDFPRLLL